MSAGMVVDESGAAEVNEEALIALGIELKGRGYSFITVTPNTQARVNARAEASRARDLRGVFGWSRPFDEKLLEPSLLALANAAGILHASDDGLRSRVRWSSLGPDLFVHSSYPTDGADSVFFGPDTVRFLAFLRRAAPRRVVRMVDVGCGSGAGGIALARHLDEVGELVLADVNPEALKLARVNAAVAKISARCVLSDVLASVADQVDLVISNPPYLVDPNERTYRSGGGALGASLSLRIAREAASRLFTGGTLLLYTGAAIIDGTDPFRAEVMPLLEASGAAVRYEELDPDVFGEELSSPAYCIADRLAVVGVEAVFSPMRE